VLDLFAPGKRTASPAALDTGSPPIDNTLIYGRFGGTSAAAPAVAGVAALYLQTDNTACPCTVSNVIKQNANAGVVTQPAGSPPDMLHVPSSWPAPSYRSLSLNGTTAYVQVPTVSSPNGVKLDITSYVTVEAWVWLNSVGSPRPVVERYSSSDGGYSLDITNLGKVKFYTLTNASTFDSVTGNTTLVANTWYHIVGQWSGLTLKVFVNGALDGFKSSTFAPGAGTSPLLIGRSVDGSYYFNGLIDEVRVTGTWLYNNSYTLQQRVAGTFETRGLWRFDYQNAQDCADMNNGTLMGGATFSTNVP
jgi:hypothetical protein